MRDYLVLAYLLGGLAYPELGEQRYGNALGESPCQ